MQQPDIYIPETAFNYHPLFKKNRLGTPEGLTQMNSWKANIDFFPLNTF